MPQVANKNFHVPLPPKLYEALKEQSERLSTPATVLAREAIERWLEEQHAKALAEAIEAYAVDVAGSEDDLDLDLEQAAEEELIEVAE